MRLINSGMAIPAELRGEFEVPEEEEDQMRQKELEEMIHGSSKWKDRGREIRF